MRRSLSPVLSIGLAAALTVGCYRVDTSGGPTTMPDRDPDYDKWESHFVYGLAKTSHLNMNDICPGGAEYSRTFVNGWQGLVGTLTLGIYTPTKRKVWCRSGATPVAPPPGYGHPVAAPTSPPAAARPAPVAPAPPPATPPPAPAAPPPAPVAPPPAPVAPPPAASAPPGGSY